MRPPPQLAIFNVASKFVVKDQCIFIGNMTPPIPCGINIENSTASTSYNNFSAPDGFWTRQGQLIYDLGKNNRSRLGAHLLWID